MASVRYLGLFPFACVADIEEYPLVSDKNDFYHEVSPEQAMALFWRVKAWKVTLVTTSTDQYGNVSVTSRVSNLQRRNEFDAIYYINSEDELVCETAPLFSFVSYDAHWGGSLFEFNGIEDFDGIVKKSGDNTFIVQINGGFSDEDFTLSEPETGTGISGTVTLDLKSLGTINWNCYAAIPSGGSRSDVCTIEASEFWPYDPNDGKGPIYNSSTGARIRNDV